MPHLMFIVMELNFYPSALNEKQNTEKSKVGVVKLKTR